MKELTRTRRLTIITIIFVFILILGFLTFSKPEFIYKLTPEETLTELSNKENEIPPGLVSEILSKKDQSFVFVDLRNPYEYGRGYIGEAINIPVSEILTNESISFFEDKQSNSVAVVLYGKDQLEANGPWMLLKQLGFGNVKVLLGGYDLISKKGKNMTYNPEMNEYQVEQPVANFAESLNNSLSPHAETSNDDNFTKQIIPIKRKKKTATAGGC